jgi:hypothetical protein
MIHLNRAPDSLCQSRWDVRGTILLEVILAMLILSVGLTAIIQAMAAALRAKTFCSDYIQAVFLADDKMFPNLTRKTSGLPIREEGKFPEDEGKYAYTLTSRTADMSKIDTPNLNEVTLKVSWASGFTTKEIDLVTYVSSSE